MQEDGASRLVAGTEPSFDVGTLDSTAAHFTASRCRAGTVLELVATTTPATPPSRVWVSFLGQVG